MVPFISKNGSIYIKKWPNLIENGQKQTYFVILVVVFLYISSFSIQFVIIDYVIVIFDYIIVVFDYIIVIFD